MDIYLDGHIIFTDGGTTAYGEAALRALAHRATTSDVFAAIELVCGGSFNGVVYDARAKACYVIRDRLGTIPLYISDNEEGFAASTTPSALLRVGAVEPAVDVTAFAELFYIGYTVGGRHPVKQIEIASPRFSLCWSSSARRLEKKRHPNDPFEIVPEDRRPNTEHTASLIKQACSRLHGLGIRTAQLQSAGFDSRMILAAWPSDVALPCYTYGKRDSTETLVAAEVAELSGSRFTHCVFHGDLVADSLDRMFDRCGILAYPDRFLIAESMAQESMQASTDGFLGDALLGGLFFDFDRYFGALGLARYSTGIASDRAPASVGRGALVTAMLQSIVEVPRSISSHRVGNVVSSEFGSQLDSSWKAMEVDVEEEFVSLTRSGTPLSAVWRNFRISNRSLHAISQQGAMMRHKVDVLYPFATDRDLLEHLIHISPTVTAFKTYYINVFREHFPAHADIRYGSSLLPLRRSTLSHRVSHTLLKRGHRIPILTGQGPGGLVSANNWLQWFRESARLRDWVSSVVLDARIARPDKLKRLLDAVSAGQEVYAIGKLLHLATLAKWIRVCRW